VGKSGPEALKNPRGTRFIKGIPWKESDENKKKVKNIGKINPKVELKKRLRVLDKLNGVGGVKKGRMVIHTPTSDHMRKKVDHAKTH